MWIKRLIAITNHAFRITIADPFYQVLFIAMVVVELLLGVLPGFTTHEHMRMLRDQSLALLFLLGCLTLTYSSIRVITDDIRQGGGAVLRSRPVGAFCAILGKWLGIIMSLILLYFTGLIVYLWISEIAAESDYLNQQSLICLILTLLVGLTAGALRHYLWGGSYGFYSNLLVAGLLIAVFVIRLFIIGLEGFDWPGFNAGIILLFGLIAFSGIMLPIAVVADSALVLAAGLSIFLFGLISDYLINLSMPFEMLRQIVKAVLPNWQLYWMSDRIGDNLSIPGSYYFYSGAQSLLFLTVYLIVAVIIYDRMESQTVL